MNPQQNGLPDEKLAMDSELHKDSNYAGYSARTVKKMQAIEKFRYLVTLNAPTAMIKYSDEIPVTYLNKGQVYTVSICDSTGLGPALGPVKYRTVIRISLDDEQQWQRLSAFRQLWKEGRDPAKVYQRDGKLQAVEYVDLNQAGNTDTKQSCVELETTFFDCFSVTWIPSPGSTTAECSVAVRFNFLSTDFGSSSWKGIPVRFCAKTEIISSHPSSPSGPVSEVCYCNVKLYQKRSAERKHSYEVANIKKKIDKLKQQITQGENGVKKVGRRKRSGPDKGGSHRPGKIRKHKRAGSVLSQGSRSQPAVEEDLHLKLTTMQDMLTSTRPVSVLDLKGYGQDACPVSLPGEPPDLTRVCRLDPRTSWNQKKTSGSKPANSCHVSPSPSSRSMPSDPQTSEQSPFRSLQLSTQKTHCMTTRVRRLSRGFWGR